MIHPVDLGDHHLSDGEKALRSAHLLGDLQLTDSLSVLVHQLDRR